jgi:hypothetical protein
MEAFETTMSPRTLRIYSDWDDSLAWERMPLVCRTPPGVSGNCRSQAFGVPAWICCLEPGAVKDAHPGALLEEVRHQPVDPDRGQRQRTG